MSSRRHGVATHQRPIEQAEAGGGAVADEDVLGDAEIREQARMLVHDRDAVALGIERCAELGSLAVEHDLARIRAGRRRPAA